MNRKIAYAALASLGALSFGFFAACGGDESSELGTEASSSGQGAGSSGTGGNGTSTTSDGGFTTTSTAQGGSTGQGGDCGSLLLTPVQNALPADIIFVIDNSGSMSEEINSVEQNINTNFAAIINNSGVDYQVIMVTDHGTGSYDVCIGPPLSGTTACGSAPVEVPNQFYHYDVNVQSHDSLCLALDTLYGVNGGGEADENGNHLNGWDAVMRPNAVKIFVEVSDDGISCTWDGTNFNDSDQVAPGQQVALDWDNKLLALDPVQFGTQSNRNYVFYSIVGMPPNTNQMPYTEFDPVVTGTCQGGVGPGTGYQWLSKGTGGLRFPVCSYQSYDAVFNDIAAGVLDVTAIPCEFDLPDPPMGEQYDYNTLDIIYTPNGNGAPQTFVKVDSVGLCMPGAFYIESGNHVVLCPQACQVIEADDNAKVDVSLQCGFIPA